jgi:hypothetical protein
MTSLAEMFGLFERTAVRCEARDSYLMTDKARYDLWRSGQPLPRKTRDNDSWIATNEDARARNAQIGRYRIVGRPITDYTRFEFAAFRDNVRAGEWIAVVERAGLDPSWVDVPDFWFFDDEIVFVQYYDDQGGFLGADQADDLGPFREVLELLSGVAVPFRDYELTDIPHPRVEDETARVAPLPIVLQRAHR